MNSSTRPSGLSPAGPTPPDKVIRFSLSGPSRPFDAARQAIRADLADVAEAEHHFAPHYAAALPCRANALTGLFARVADEQPLVSLAAGAAFAVLDVTGGWAWGYETATHRVGYVRASDLDQDQGAAQ